MGLMISIIIILAWLTHLVYSLFFVIPDFSDPVFYFHMLFQGYLFTGLFITGHDAMHGTVTSNRTINQAIGWIATFLFAGLNYKRLIKNHAKHHQYPAQEKDPDFYVRSQNFFRWFGIFMYRYVTVWQILIMAVAYNVLHVWFSDQKLIFLWIIPAFIGTLQMFYFGVYVPHKYPHQIGMKPYNARTQKKNHLWAMLSCYFFGYHYEHHASPQTPWWKLHQKKLRYDKSQT
jgi:beta-carotene ketolase (CrtW type)